MGEKSIFLSHTFRGKRFQDNTQDCVQRRDKGLCYFCDDHFTQTHSLIHKKLQIHILKTNIRHTNECNELTKTSRYKLNR